MAKHQTAQAAKTYAKHLEDARKAVVKELYIPKALKGKISKELASSKSDT